MKHTEKTFQILDALDREDISSQRQLADNSGISLGQVNYILKRLLEKGLVKISNFKKNPHKIGYTYFLTPKGFEEKSKLAVKFVLRKLEEYEFLRDRLTQRLIEIEKEGFIRFIFIGPDLVKSFIENIIKENKISLILVDFLEDPAQKDNINCDSFDVALFFDEGQSAYESVKQELGLTESRLISLW